MEEKTQLLRPKEDKEPCTKDKCYSYAPDPPRHLATPPAPKDLKVHRRTVILLEENDPPTKPRFPFLKKLFGKKDRKGSK